MQQPTGPIVLLGLIVLGFALFWARHLVYGRRAVATDDVMKLILSIAGAVCVVIGIGGTITHGLVLFAPVGLLIVTAVGIMLITRYRSLERRSLLRCMSLAAQKGIPLNEAIRAFANERSDELGLRAVRLAEAIEAGMPVPTALITSGTRLPDDALLAVRIGYETGTLSESLTRITRVDEDLDLLVRSVYEKLLYLFWIWLWMIGVLIYVMVRIMPVIQRLFLDFELRLPAATQQLVDLCNFTARFWIVGVPVILALLGAACMGVLHYINLLPRGAPMVQQLSRRWDAALIMRVLAMAVHHQWPMNKAVWLLSRVFPSPPVRGLLMSAATRIDNGENWCNSLLHLGLITSPDSAVFQAASRVGNLEWALDEMADGSIRRLVYRLRLALSVVFPLTLFIFGIIVGYIAISLFLPMISLIQGLT